MDKELNTLLGELNKTLQEFKEKFPKEDWTKDTREELIQNFTFHSNKIEGLGLSYGETIIFLKEGLIENKLLSEKGIAQDITMLSNHQKALDLILSEYEKSDFTINFIQSIHNEILRTDTFEDEENRPGMYRNDDCYTTRTDGTRKYFLYDNQIPEAMDKLVERTNERMRNASFDTLENHPFVIAIDLHVDFLNIHPFSDGNGRTARLLMNMVNMKFKLPPFSPNSDEEERKKYFDVFSECDKTGNNIPMHHYMGKRLLEVMKQAIQ